MKSTKKMRRYLEGGNDVKMGICTLKGSEMNLMMKMEANYSGHGDDETQERYAEMDEGKEMTRKEGVN
jgi:hypothetical protein